MHHKYTKPTCSFEPRLNVSATRPSTPFSEQTTLKGSIDTPGNRLLDRLQPATDFVRGRLSKQIRDARTTVEAYELARQSKIHQRREAKAKAERLEQLSRVCQAKRRLDCKAARNSDLVADLPGSLWESHAVGLRRPKDLSRVKTATASRRTELPDESLTLQRKMVLDWRMVSQTPPTTGSGRRRSRFVEVDISC